MRLCHYETLGVDRRATPEELKKAYRKKALELHPDKNPTRIAEATQLFAEVQQAYEVLSDEQERAWYDSHREAILRGDDDPGAGSAPGGSGSASYVSVTTVEDLMRFFNASCFKGFSTDDRSFFSIYRDLFLRLEEEEEDAIRHDSEATFTPDPDGDMDQDGPERATFGGPSDPYDPTVKRFYSKFSNFTSCKSFRWHDRHRLSDAPDRRIRRMMEKENKKFRETARREFVDAIRELVAFVRKRDPRVARYLEEQKRVKAEKEKENKARIAREKEERARNAEAYKEPEWSKVKEVDYSAENLEEDCEEEELYCVACEKGFKSEKQFENHERSKKHIRNVEILRQQLLEDD
ncbi:hypothetical protein BDK51DRAFT_11941, partial [Blyttiomyces helicus]